MNQESFLSELPESMALFERAARVIPCGIYGHMSPITMVPGRFPYFAKSARGCRYTDVDGREYIDFMCGYGPIVLGYQHPEVEEAAEKQRREGDCFNHPTERTVELAERLVEFVDIASWAVFAKNGSDVTTWAIQVAREKTRKKKILCVKGAYHGTHAWCTPGHGGLIEEDRQHIHIVNWNDPEDFERIIKSYSGQIAGIVLTPYHHPVFADSQMPAQEWIQTIHRVCEKEGILIILDDVRAGFRLHLGGSHRFFGWQPDIICFSKAIANGYPLAAAVGREELRVAASKVFLTGSFWQNAVPIAASLACLRVLERENVIETMRTMGERLMRGLVEKGEKQGQKVIVSGPPAVPFMTLEDDPGFYKSQLFSSECIRRGVFFHPHHNWFVSAAHTQRDIDEALEVAEQAFEVVSSSTVAAGL